MEQHNTNNDQIKNPARDSEMSLEAKILSTIKNLGDLVERGGEKLESAGFKKIGEAVYELGNKIEHLGESKTSPAQGLKTDSSDKSDAKDRRQSV